MRLLLSLVLLAAAAGAPPRSHELDSSYTFENYVVDFDKVYERGSDEWQRRESIFLRNLRTILEHNSAYYTTGSGAGDSKEGRGEGRPTHTLGANHFMDLDFSELPYGYDKAGHPSWRRSSETATARRLGGKHKKDLPFVVDPVSDLPDRVDWRERGVVTPVKDQGGCGSCWAFASTAVLESHVALRTGTLFDLSPQELVSCVPNPNHCGGSGGCAGATAELAFDFVADKGHGVVQEFQFGYTSYYGEDGECSILKDGTSPVLRGADTGGPDPKGIKGAVASIEGYANVPTNDYAVLMNAIAKTGPVAVAVAASTWALYEGGVFSVDLSEGGKATDMNHAVVLVGYGTDEDTGEDYWLVRNSWRPTWGEGGYIRLKRVDPNTLDNPEENCGIDATPLDGMACEIDENGNPPPKTVKVCGTSGILYDGVVPVGGYRIH